MLANILTRSLTVKTVLPIVLAVFAAGSVTGWTINGWRIGSKVAEVKQQWADEKATMETAHSAAMQKAKEEWERQATEERQHAEQTIADLRQANIAAEQKRKELEDALNADHLADCHAPGTWRVLANLHEDITNRHLQQIARARDILGGSGPAPAAPVTGPPPTSCAAALRYVRTLLLTWDELATKFRGLQIIVRQRELAANARGSD